MNPLELDHVTANVFRFDFSTEIEPAEQETRENRYTKKSTQNAIRKHFARKTSKWKMEAH
ncbi:CLUMA_CG019927, isoform A [Clunio marinus]|uniref:CLUMA_CG019927, isoform A n=1 Tax=Clunio marinus TaxID=568069 RepID=A0A1J1J345_9DIPT|nr:CLUMA_CG019927, isoform A [Clunio marinus]